MAAAVFPGGGLRTALFNNHLTGNYCNKISTHQTAAYPPEINITPGIRNISMLHTLNGKRRMSY
jgi:hypothetical protein